MACNDVIVAPAELTIEDFDGASNDLILGTDDQDGPMQIAINQQDFPIMTQASVFPCAFSRQGEEITVNLTLNTYDIETFAFLVRHSVITDGADNTKKKFEATSDVGQKAPGYKMIIKPTVGGVAVTDANQWITLPNGQLVNQNIAIAFAKDQQTQIPISIYGSPDSGGIRYIRGDETAVA